MRRHALIAVPLAMLIVSLSGCARTSGTGPGSPTDSTPAPTASSAPTSDSAGCPQNLTVTASDSGKTLCVRKGGTVTFDLGPDMASASSPLDVSGNALTRGQAEGTYLAANTGTATVTTERHNCPSPSAGQLGCHSIQLWKVVIEVK